MRYRVLRQLDHRMHLWFFYGDRAPMSSWWMRPFRWVCDAYDRELTGE